MTETPKSESLHRCVKCGKLKPLTGFPRDSHLKSGYRKICRVCYNKRERENHGSNTQSSRKSTGMSREEIIMMASLPYPNDPLRVNPEHKQTITESGVYVYSDTCATCESYSAFYGGCRIRESSDNQSVVKRASVPMSVSAGEKCKLWKAK